MPEYCIYFVGENGLVTEHRPFRAPTDSVAIGLADDARGENALELWRGREMIKRWEGQQKSGPA